MDRHTLRYWLASVAGFYVLVVVSAIILHSNGMKYAYQVLKDFSVVLLAIPAGWLAECFRRRSEFVKCVREVYALANAVTQKLVQYTFAQSPSRENFSELQRELSKCIDDARTVFKNIGKTANSRGLFPLEGLKTQREWLDHVGFEGNFRKDQAAVMRRSVIWLWQNTLRDPLLFELDRFEPKIKRSVYIERTGWPRPPARSRVEVEVAVVPRAELRSGDLGGGS